jgi:hypothetical protein
MRYLKLFFLPLLWICLTGFDMSEFEVIDSFQMEAGNKVLRFYKCYRIDQEGDTTYKTFSKELQKEVSPPKKKDELFNWDGPRPSSYGEYGEPYNSTQHFSPLLAAIITCSFLLFVLYIAIRVRKSLRRDGNKEKDIPQS